MFQVTQETSKAHRVHAKLRQDAIKSTCAKFKRADQVDPPMSAIVFDFDFFAFQSPSVRQSAFCLKTDFILKENSPGLLDLSAYNTKIVS